MTRRPPGADQPHEVAWTRLFEQLDAIETVQTLATRQHGRRQMTNEMSTASDEEAMLALEVVFTEIKQCNTRNPHPPVTATRSWPTMTRCMRHWVPTATTAWPVRSTAASGWRWGLLRDTHFEHGGDALRAHGIVGFGASP